MKSFFFLPFVLLSLHGIAQTQSSSFESYPVFPECKDVHFNEQEKCFSYQLKNFIYEVI